MSQQLVIEVLEGPQAGRRIVVAPGSPLLIGRLPECGLSVPTDLTVSRQHCRIEMLPSGGRLVHLSQTGDTLHNGVRTTQAALANGDEIAFGEGNLLRVRLQEAGPDPEPTRIVAGDPGRFETAKMQCGWSMFQAASNRPAFGEILHLLMQKPPIYAVCDFARMKAEPPADADPQGWLFGWLPESARSMVSPMLLSSATQPRLAEIVQAGWGRDGIVCCGSALDPEAMLAHWRTAIGAPDNQPGPALTVYYWPSILNVMFESQKAEQLEPFLSNIQWLLVESPKSPGNWRLYAPDEKFAQTLEAAGLQATKSP